MWLLPSPRLRGSDTPARRSSGSISAGCAANLCRVSRRPPTLPTSRRRNAHANSLTRSPPHHSSAAAAPALRPPSRRRLRPGRRDPAPARPERAAHPEAGHRAGRRRQRRPAPGADRHRRGRRPARGLARGLRLPAQLGDLIFSRRTTPPLSAQDVQGGFNNNLAARRGPGPRARDRRRREPGLRTNPPTPTTACSAAPRRAAASDCTIYGSNVDLTFNHPLLRGFGSDIAQANIRRKRVQKDQALLNRQMRAANVMRDVINTYWGLSYATQDLAIRRSAVELAREQLRVTQAQIDVGRLAPVDAAAVERAIGERMQEVLLSEQELLFRTLELRRLFGLPAEPDLPGLRGQRRPRGHPARGRRRRGDRPGAGEQPAAALGQAGHGAHRDRHRDGPLHPAPAAGLRGPGRAPPAAATSCPTPWPRRSGFDDLTWSAGLQLRGAAREPHGRGPDARRPAWPAERVAPRRRRPRARDPQPGACACPRMIRTASHAGRAGQGHGRLRQPEPGGREGPLLGGPLDQQRRAAAPAGAEERRDPGGARHRRPAGRRDHAWPPSPASCSSATAIVLKGM